MRERWQRQGTASAHIMATVSLRAISLEFAVGIDDLREIAGRVRGEADFSQNGLPSIDRGTAEGHRIAGPVGELEIYDPRKSSAPGFILYGKDFAPSV